MHQKCGLLRISPCQSNRGPAGEDFYPERPSRVNDLSSNPKKDFNPACLEPRRAEHPDERTASSAYGVYPDPVGVPLRLVLLRLSTCNLQMRSANAGAHASVLRVGCALLRDFSISVPLHPLFFRKVEKTPFPLEKRQAPGVESLLGHAIWEIL